MVRVCRVGDRVNSFGLAREVKNLGVDWFVSKYQHLVSGQCISWSFFYALPHTLKPRLNV